MMASTGHDRFFTERNKGMTQASSLESSTQSKSERGREQEEWALRALRPGNLTGHGESRKNVQKHKYPSIICQTSSSPSLPLDQIIDSLRYGKRLERDYVCCVGTIAMHEEQPVHHQCKLAMQT